MKAERAVISPEAFAGLAQQAEAAYPRECCGLLLGKRMAAGWRIVRTNPMRNASGKPEQSFEFDPAEQLRAYRAADAAGWEVLGHYHSHPNGRQQPSPTDLQLALERSDYGLWLIVAVSRGRWLATGLWQLRGNPVAFQRLRLEINSSAGE